MDEFGFVFDKLSANYSEIEGMMSAIYDKLQVNPENKELQNILQGLGQIAKNIISTQMDFTEIYCDSSMKESIMASLDNRQESLMDALDIDKGRTL